jgi:hypothetical protein
LVDEALRVVIEMNDCVWQRFKKDLEDVTSEEAAWRPVPEANSINLILRHARIDALWHVASIERSDQASLHDAAVVQQPSESIPLDFSQNLEALDESHARFMASLGTLTLPGLRQRTRLAYEASPGGPPSEHFLGFHFALHLAAHDGQVRTLRNLYRRTRGEPARFFPDNPTFPT